MVDDVEVNLGFHNERKEKDIVKNGAKFTSVSNSLNIKHFSRMQIEPSIYSNRAPINIGNPILRKWLPRNVTFVLHQLLTSSISFVKFSVSI